MNTSKPAMPAASSSMDAGRIGERLTAKRAQIGSFIVMDVMRAASDLEARGSDIIHMEVGQPGTPAPQAARDAAKRALDRDNLGYTLALGMPELRERISRHYKDCYGLGISAERIIVTSGSSAGFILAFISLFDAGQRVGLPNPGYPCYRQILKALDVETTLIDTSESDRWMPTAASIEAAHEASRLAGVLVASPANPTGTMLEPERLREIAATCDRLGMWFVSDEIYHGLTYGAPTATALEFSENAIVINSFSKYFSMTGWRVGWMVLPPALMRTFEKLSQNLFICAPAISQMAALGAFDGIEELEANRQTYAGNRDILIEELPKAGFDRIVPADGAFYLYCDVSEFGIGSDELANRVLHEAGVAVTPGIDFDPARGGRFLRFSYARSRSDILEAARRLRMWNATRT